jgi:hypothetical protein
MCQWRKKPTVDRGVSFPEQSERLLDVSCYDKHLPRACRSLSILFAATSYNWFGYWLRYKFEYDIVWGMLKYCIIC